MKTSQAFPFYPTDFLLGTALLSDAQVGAYMRLMCYQWQEGSLPNDENLLAKLACTEVGNVSAILDKFKTGRDGRLRNARLEQVRKGLNVYRKSRSDNGKKGGRPKKHMVSVCLAPQNHSESFPSPIPFPIPSPNPKERESLISSILTAYPRRDSPDRCRIAIESAENSGENLTLIRQLVRECASHINSAPGGAGNRYVPTAKAFFENQHWRHPEVFAERWRTDESGDNERPSMKL